MLRNRLLRILALALAAACPAAAGATVQHQSAHEGHDRHGHADLWSDHFRHDFGDASHGNLWTHDAPWDFGDGWGGDLWSHSVRGSLGGDWISDRRSDWSRDDRRADGSGRDRGDGGRDRRHAPHWSLDGSRHHGHRRREFHWHFGGPAFWDRDARDRWLDRDGGGKHAWHKCRSRFATTACDGGAGSLPLPDAGVPQPATPVPLPGSLPLIGAALAALALAGCRRSV